MKNLRDYFIGDILKSTDDAFEHARAIMLLRLSLMFVVIFILPIIGDVALSYNKAIIFHSIAFLCLFSFCFIIRWQKNIDKSINLFFSISLVLSVLIFMVINPESLHMIGVCWTVFFLVLSVLLQTGKTRILFACFLNWLPMLYVLINTELNGAITWEWIREKDAESPPVFLIFIPIGLTIYSVWTHTTTIEKARQTITDQKHIIDEKNKDIVDSIHYAKRIQTSLLPTEKYIERILNKTENKID